MPIYEYRCEDCGAHVERMQRITEPPLTDCPKCGGKLHKLISLSSFKLKGTGWYVTDYKGKNPQPSNGDGLDKTSEEKTPTDSTADKVETAKKTSVASDTSTAT